METIINFILKYLLYLAVFALGLLFVAFVYGFITEITSLEKENKDDPQ